MARSEAHFSLVAAAPLPIFMLLLMRATRTLAMRDAALAGAAVAWASICDPYYGIFCVLMAACYVVARCVRVRVAPEPARSHAWLPLVNALTLAATAIVGVIVVTGGAESQWLGVRIAMKSLYTPVLLLLMLVALQVVLRRRPSFAVQDVSAASVVVKLLAVAGVVCTALLSPVLYAFRSRLADGGELHGRIFWRNSPPGVDLLALFTPNPNHAWFGGPWREWLTGESGGYVENVASLTIVGIAVVAVAVWRYRFRPRRPWLAMAVFFAALAAGPFVHVGGANTFIPGPWALLRYAPIISATRTPARFAVVAMMAFSLIFGMALARIARQHRDRRRVILVLAGLVLAFELSPAPRQLFPATIPDIYATIANDPRDVRVLELPFGVRDGERSEGNFNASSQFYQTFHQKRIYGGYLSRITRRAVDRQRQQQTLHGLIDLSAGEPVLPARLEELKSRAPGFVERTRMGYVVIHTARTPAALRQFAIDAFRLVKVAEQDGHELYVPTTSTRVARE
jgi:hypothetical protein